VLPGDESDFHWLQKRFMTAAASPATTAAM
jgi:hypothetical protein